MPDKFVRRRAIGLHDMFVKFLLHDSNLVRRELDPGIASLQIDPPAFQS
jgi:hypothetical protein